MMILQQQQQQHPLGAEARQTSAITFKAEVPRYSPRPATPPASPAADSYVAPDSPEQRTFVRSPRTRSRSVDEPSESSPFPEREVHSADFTRVVVESSTLQAFTAAERKMYPAEVDESSSPKAADEPGESSDKPMDSESEAPLDLSVSAAAKEDKFFRHPREISVREFAKEQAAGAREEAISRYSRDIFRDPRDLLHESRDYTVRDPRDFVLRECREAREFLGVPGEFRDPREFVRQPSDSGTDSDDSGGRLSPSDTAGKAYKKSLMKRYCKSFSFSGGLPLHAGNVHTHIVYGIEIVIKVVLSHPHSIIRPRNVLSASLFVRSHVHLLRFEKCHT